jgi:hypothetical protein
MKKISLFLICLVLVYLCGCGLLGPNSPTSVTVTIKNSSINLTAGGAATYIEGEIEADSILTNVEFKVLNSSNSDVTSNYFVISFVDAYKDKKKVDIKNDLNATIAAKSNTPGGTYILQITASSGSISSSTTKNFTVTSTVDTTPQGTPVSEKSVTLGAQNANPPSCLDADNMTAYSSSTTDPNIQAKIDIIFSYSTVLNPASLAFTSPAIAAGTPYSSWSNKASTEFKKVSATWNNITTQEQIDSLWNTVTTSSQRIAVSSGDIIVVKTSESKYKIINITNINGSDGTATMDIKGKY